MKAFLQISILILVIQCGFGAWAQDSIPSKLKFEADFRFRLEQDWNSRKSDGTFRDDRTRLRYRVRTGFTFNDGAYEVGVRARTGNLRKQQDPQLTLGDNFAEFGTLPIGLEKAYFKAEWQLLDFWLGKNTFPFAKSNELFWSDNVYPEGVHLSKKMTFDSSKFDFVDINLGHFLIRASGKSLDMDTYMQGGQVHLSMMNKQLELFPSVFYFKNMPNRPDGGENYYLDYMILDGGLRFKPFKSVPLRVEANVYHNLLDYSSNDSIVDELKNQKSGWVAGLKYGGLKKKGDWVFKATYAHLQQFSIVDFMAQNDWARWDYSSYNSPDGRLTNYQGIELYVGYAITDRLKFKTKCYFVDQLVPNGSHRETGSRIRFDIDFKI